MMSGLSTSHVPSRARSSFMTTCSSSMPTNTSWLTLPSLWDLPRTCAAGCVASAMLRRCKIRQLLLDTGITIRRISLYVGTSSYPNIYSEAFQDSALTPWSGN